MHPIQNEVVAQTAKDLAELTRVNDEVVASITEDYVFFVSARDGIVTITTFDYIGTGEVSNNVITRSAFDKISAVTALDSVVTWATQKGIIPDAANDRVIMLSAADGNVVTTGVLEDKATNRIEGNFDVSRQEICSADYQRNQYPGIGHGISCRAITRSVELPGLIDLQNMVRD